MAADARARQPGSRALRFLLVFCLGLVVLAFATSLWVERSPSGLLAGGEKRIALVDLRGEITASERFVEMLGDLDEDDGVRAVVVRVDSPGGAVAPSQEMYAAVRKLRERKPVIASVQGHALGGGCELTMFCDVTIAADNAIFGEPEIHFSNVGPAIVMPWMIGFKMARELLYLGDMIDAETTVISGPCDATDPPAAQTYTSSISGAVHHEIPNSGHWPMVENRAEFRRRVGDALRY